MFFVYILEASDGSYYTGYTNNLSRRIKQHNSGRGSKYLRGRLPAVLRYSESLGSKSDALKREHQIKKLCRLDKQNLFSRGVNNE